MQKFADAGNTVVGRPSQISGNLTIPEFEAGSTIIFGENCHLIAANFRFPKGGGTLHIGNNVTIRLNTKIGPRSQIIIGNNTSFNSLVNILAWEGRSVHIGKNCLFSNARLRTSDMHPLYDGVTGKRINFAKDIIIEDEVWIGEDVIIGKGAHIGSGTVIGARSYVLGAIPRNCAAAGTPAAVVREKVVWQRGLSSKPRLLKPERKLSFWKRLIQR